MEVLGLAISLGIITGAAVTVGTHLFFDINSLVFVLGGATGFLVMTQRSTLSTSVKGLFILDGLEL